MIQSTEDLRVAQTHVSRSLFLPDRYPLLFSFPSQVQARYSLLFSFFVVMLALLWLAAAPEEANNVHYSLAFGLLSIHAYFTIQNTANVLFLLRYFLIWLLTAVTALVWAIYLGEVLVAPFGPQYQTHDVTIKIVAAGIIAVCGTGIGWNLRYLRIEASILQYDYFSYLRKNSSLLRYTGFGLAMVFALFYLIKKGAVSSGKLYASGQGVDFGFEFGASNILIFIGVSITIMGVAAANMQKFQTFLLVCVPLMIPILAGSRGDYLIQFFVLLVSVVMYSSKISKRRLTGVKKLSSKHIGITMLLVLLLILSHSFIGKWRSTGNSTEVNSIFSTFSELVLVNKASHTMVKIPTGHQILGTFYAVLNKLKVGESEYLLGESYVDYILRSPPSFLGIKKPRDLAWEMNVHGVRMASGGIFEIAEAYWNFGLLGAFLLPLSITYFMASLLRKAIFFGSPFYISFFVAFGLHAPRSVWYQNFSYFRLVTIFLVIYFTSKLISKTYVRIRSEKRA